jgi:hypothetical protein
VVLWLFCASPNLSYFLVVYQVHRFNGKGAEADNTQLWPTPPGPPLWHCLKRHISSYLLTCISMCRCGRVYTYCKLSLLLIPWCSGYDVRFMVNIDGTGVQTSNLSTHIFASIFVVFFLCCLHQEKPPGVIWHSFCEIILAGYYAWTSLITWDNCLNIHQHSVRKANGCFISSEVSTIKCMQS